MFLEQGAAGKLFRFLAVVVSKKDQCLQELVLELDVGFECDRGGVVRQRKAM